MNVYVFGNPYVGEDSMAFDIAKRLSVEGVRFIACATPDEALLACDDPLVILDVAFGIDEVSVTEDVSKVNLRSSDTAHDLDLAVMLKLMRAAGNDRRVILVAVPQEGRVGELADDVTEALTSLKEMK